MELLMVLTYAGLCYLVFKVFKVPVNQWTLTTAVLGGVAMLGTTMLLMNYNHPYSKTARFYFFTTPIIPEVAGQVIEVAMKEGVPVKKGDLLFRIDPEEFEQRLAAAEAALELAEAQQSELEASVKSAKARLRAQKARAKRERATAQRYAEANQPGGPSPFSELDVETRLNTAQAAEADVSRAAAEARRAEVAQDESGAAELARARANLRLAQLDLQATEVRAPTDGVPTQVMLRPGMRATPLPLRPLAVFVHDEEPVFVGSFLQNGIQRVGPGYEAEIALNTVPGRIFKAKVSRIIDAMAAGQLQPSGNLYEVSHHSHPSRVAVVFDFEEPEALRDFLVPRGSEGVVAVYSPHMHPLIIIRKILLRMVSWRNYIYSEGH